MDTSNKNDKAAKTIATIDVNLTIPKIDKKAWREEALDDHFQCVLCGTHLVFKHKTDFIAQSVVEEAHCEQCGVRNRHSTFSLQ